MIKQHVLIIITCFLIITKCIFAQQPAQNIKGTIIDRESEMPLPGATVIVVNSDPVGTTSDINGHFRLDDITVGRITLKISYVGYEEQYVNDILVSSGKEIVLKISLKESFSSLNEVVIKADTRKEKAINSMATISARTVSVEEAGRFAGGMDDPSRLASTFAGVTPSTVDNNEIVIRGNAAKGILWKLEGVEIPAPNHLAGMFSGGGVNTMFSSNILANSDFFTGAFPAEYGNAISGVFDIKLRSGNYDKREYVFQVGTQGVDLELEGPFIKGKGSSYLINYRYSTLGLIQNIIPQVTGMPTYSDLTLKMDFPTKKAGIFTFWSLAGMGNIANKLDKDTANWETNMEGYKYNITYNLVTAGVNNRLIISNKSYLFSSVSFSGTNYINNNVYFRDKKYKVPVTDQNEINSKTTLTSFLNYKFSNRHTNKTGFVVNKHYYDLDVKNNTNVAINDTSDFFVNSKGNAISLNFYSQSKCFLNEKTNLNLGIHLIYISTNMETVIEPRVGLNYQINALQMISFAYGKHSKMEPIRVYLMEVPAGDQYLPLNSKLNITKSHHFVLGYDINIARNTHLRVEPYYQILYDVPVIPDSSFSMINYTSETFFSEQLNNSGTGLNYGIDLTLEQFLNKGFYYMITSSLYESVYNGGDAIERNTKYNQNYVFNVLAGKEWQTKNNNTFGINGKLTVIGGKRQSPVDYEKSNKYKYVIYDESRSYEVQLPTSYYFDLSLNYTINRARFSQSIILQAKNIFMQEESLGHAYNYKSQSVEPYGLSIIYPYLSYKIQF
jgi:carboxypeptidase-like protein